MREVDDAEWMFVPRILYPDQDRIAGWNGYGWWMVPVEPHIRGKVAFITDARTIGYAESVMGLVEGYRLGEIVGRPTAGANGNSYYFELPGGISVRYTGMKVTRVGGRQFHLTGIEPTIHAAPTLAGFLDGRDELREAALAAVRR